MVPKERNSRSQPTRNIFSIFQKVDQMQGIDPGSAVYAQDEYGRPFIIVRDQQKTRIKGLEAQKV